uniref:Kelch-like protein 12 n=1 Tax=Phallusia mammillata TaxID=59560 RepID=A0A6F9DF90_9ASCI|nr:kelch-like protein 12 [Phallusia mammillata]
MKEKYEGIVNIDQIPHERLADIVEFIYTGKIKITEKNMLDFLNDAEYTQIEVLKSKCSAFLIKLLSVENCLKLWAYAKQYSLDDLLDKTNQSVAENFATVVQQESFRLLDLNNMSSVLKNRSQSCDEVVFTGISLWVNHNPLLRGEFFEKLFSQLDFSTMRLDYLYEINVQNLVKNSLVCSNMLVEALKKHAQHFQSAAASEKFLMIGGQDSETRCVSYDMFTKQVKRFPKLTTGRAGVTSLKNESDVYAIGGSKAGKCLKSCEVLGLRGQMKWKALPNMFDARDYCGSGYIDDFVFVTGGHSGGPQVYLSHCEKFDIANNEWMRISNMLYRRYGHGTVVCNNSLYCIGGHDGSKRLTSCERYDVRIGKWNEIAPLNQPRHYSSCVVLDGHIYAIGGYADSGSLSTVEIYRPEVNRWEEAKPLKVARSRPSACVVGNKILTIGGYNHGAISSVEMYSPALDTWKILFEMENPLYAASAVAF